ncbi:MAG TPA: class I SAM-dependent methyltransferase [Actinophytocola sp.]|uniref:class I SAM-dependent methyltransferase n=1 Tax=Actinophytocola sp. TaxID=1872138 RepID=UPI002DC060D3|nr:class I SAM-dependent methyltransferase [Actinophytocola sp.]HEU5474706.1 class I SAM-dependent methyltransferase [Actinophytocola sp.]
MQEFSSEMWGEGIAPWYDSRIGDFDTADEVKFLAERLPDGLVAEIGVGTGRIAVPLAAATSARVLGIDVSSAMLEILAERADSSVDRMVCDVTKSLPDISLTGAYCVLNTLPMLGDHAAQRRAVTHVRQCVVPGAPFIVQAAVPTADFFTSPCFRIQPLRMDAGFVELQITRVSPEKRLVEVQDVRITNSGTQLIPGEFHFWELDDLDAMFADCGFDLAERYADWTRQPLSKESTSAISVYRAA